MNWKKIWATLGRGFSWIIKLVKLIFFPFIMLFKLVVSLIKFILTSLYKVVIGICKKLQVTLKDHRVLLKKKCEEYMRKRKKRFWPTFWKVIGLLFLGGCLVSIYLRWNSKNSNPGWLLILALVAVLFAFIAVSKKRLNRRKRALTGEVPVVQQNPARPEPNMATVVSRGIWAKLAAFGFDRKKELKLVGAITAGWAVLLFWIYILSAAFFWEMLTIFIGFTIGIPISILLMMYVVETFKTYGVILVLLIMTVGYFAFLKSGLQDRIVIAAKNNIHIDTDLKWFSRKESPTSLPDRSPIANSQEDYDFLEDLSKTPTPGTSRVFIVQPGKWTHVLRPGNSKNYQYYHRDTIVIRKPTDHTFTEVRKPGRYPFVKNWKNQVNVDIRALTKEEGGTGEPVEVWFDFGPPFTGNQDRPATASSDSGFSVGGIKKGLEAIPSNPNR